MFPLRVQENLEGRYGSFVLPFIWYTGESKELIAREIKAVYESGAKEFVFENRAGDWFATDFWWDIFKFVLDTARSYRMRVWSLDDSHVNTGSANDSLSKAENSCYRAKNLRMDFIDVAAYPTCGAVSLPRRSDREKIVRIYAYKLNENGQSYGEAADLTGKVTDGLCLIDLPCGLWRIYFILTADPERNGVFKNYITMVSKESCRHLINEVHEKFYEHFAEYFGNTFAGFFSDEPAFGNCDGQYGPDAFNLRPGQSDKMYAWWDDFPEKLAAKLSVSEEKVMELLPALWDDMAKVSGKVRLAYMDLITELWQENFSCQIGRWCEEHQVEYIGHNLEDGGAHMRSGWGCGHYFRSMSGQHMSGMDLVFEQLMPGISTFDHAMNKSSLKRESAFYHYTLPKMASSLAHLTPAMKNRALSEVFGATGWSCGIFNMHAIFNLCQVCGVNHFIPHAFSMSLPECFEQQQQRSAKSTSYTPPGYCLRYLPPNFYTGTYNPQYPLFGEIVRCAQRVSHISANALHLPDLAVCYNAECDWMNCGTYQDLDEVTMNLTRSGYDYDIVPLDALEKAELQDGYFRINREKFHILALPGGKCMPEKMVEICRRFSAAGVMVCMVGMMPECSENGAVEIDGVINCSASELPGILRQNFAPGFELMANYPDLRRYLLKDEEGHLLTLLFNSGVEELTLHFRESGMVYDPWRNRVFRLPENRRLSLSSQKLLIYYPDLADETMPEYPALPAKWQTLDLRYDIYMKEAGKSDFRLLRKNSRAENLLIQEKLFRCCAEFCYETEFDHSGEKVTMLQIPCAGDAAEVIINGESCGTALGNPCRFDISGKVRPGKNHLVIRTFDNPSYVDRKGDSFIGYGAWFPLQLHGFCGDIQIG